MSELQAIITPDPYSEVSELDLIVPETSASSSSVYQVQSGTWCTLSVAVKTLKLCSSDSQVGFTAALRRLAKLRWCGIARLYGSNLRGSSAKLVYSMVEGGTLHARLHPGGVVVGAPLPRALTLKLAHDIAQSLAYAHALGYAHCDLSSASVLLEARGGAPSAVLADFGLLQCLQATMPATKTALLNGAQSLSAAVGWMAPEALSAPPAQQQQQAAADVYSLGIVLYEMASGLVPWAGLSMVSWGMGVAWAAHLASLDDASTTHTFHAHHTFHAPPPSLSISLKCARAWRASSALQCQLAWMQPSGGSLRGAGRTIQAAAQQQQHWWLS